MTMLTVLPALKEACDHYQQRRKDASDNPFTYATESTAHSQWENEMGSQVARAGESVFAKLRQVTAQEDFHIDEFQNYLREHGLIKTIEQACPRKNVLLNGVQIDVANLLVSNQGANVNSKFSARS